MKKLNFVSSGADLVGKTIKYCNINNGEDGNELNIVATEDGDILCFDVDYDNGDIATYSEGRFMGKMYRGWFVEELLKNDVIDKSFVDKYRKRKEEVSRKQDESMKEYRYKQYLEMKKEFE